MSDSSISSMNWEKMLVLLLKLNLHLDRIRMATKKEIDERLKRALKEIGEITPVFEEEVGEWVFSTPLYPVEYGGASEKEVIKNYPKYLGEFMKHCLEDKLHSLMKKKMKDG